MGVGRKPTGGTELAAVVLPARLPVAARRGGAVEAGLRELDGQLVGWFRLAGGDHHGAIGDVEGDTITRLVHTAVDAGAPVLGVLDTSGAEVGAGVAALHAWGGVARALARASGVVPVVLVVIGPCVSGPALLLGLADVVVMTADAVAYVSGPGAVQAWTGTRIAPELLGGSAMHDQRSGVAHLVAPDEQAAVSAALDVLDFLPSHNLAGPPWAPATDPADRDCSNLGALVPEAATASYDMGQAVADVVDDAKLLELRPRHAPNLITGLARIGGAPVGVVANQPAVLAGTLDQVASQKGARFVQWCDAFNLPLVTFVDTPGFLPGKDIEWGGMIRKGAQLVHAYAAATVPRLCVITRKAYGGAYIVMDSKDMGNDLCVAWPTAEVAVMGAPGAVRVLHRRTLAALAGDEAEAEQARLEADYTERYCNARIAAERGYIDDLIEPVDTRRVLAAALRSLGAKREHLPQRRHANTPL
ncbi:acyl-CoA carboxylase subunit beta [soil metagenome]